MSQYKQGLQVSIRLVSDCLWTQAYITAFDIGLNVFSEAWPMVFVTNEVLGFINVKMSYQRVVVMSTDELCSDGF